MILQVHPTQSLRGNVALPASKSYSIRAFVVAACGGTSTILHPSDCEDAIVSMNVAKILGADIKQLKKNVYQVTANPSARLPKIINVGESGTSLRFILPLASLKTNQTMIVGEGTLRGRPNVFLTQALRNMGKHIRGVGDKESIPIEIQGGSLRGGNIVIDGGLSSQFISALLIACPMLAEDTILRLKGKKVVSADYIVMTLQVLERAGIQIRNKGSRSFMISGRQRYRGLKHFTVPSDYGLAAFLLAAASLVKSNIVFSGYLKDDFIQADGHIMGFLKNMGVRFKKNDKAIHIQGPFQLKGGSFSLKACPDLVPIMAVLALFAKGKTRLYDIGHARAKESDRISDLRNELLKVGAKIVEKSNEMIIEPQKVYKNNCHLDPHHDHRLAMAFAVLGLKLGVVIKDIECSHKSYPGFVRDFKTIGAVARFMR
jgi:3-phosphoshikimate 1-carboxyvinyltransferase